MATSTQQIKAPLPPPTNLPPQPGPSATPSGGIPDGLVLIGTLLISGGIAQILYRISPRAGYMFAVLVVIGFIAAGDQLKVFLDTIAKFTGTA